MCKITPRLSCCGSNLCRDLGTKVVKYCVVDNSGFDVTRVLNNSVYTYFVGTSNLSIAETGIVVGV